MSDIEGADNALRLINMAGTGALVFELKVLEIEPETELLVKNR